MDKIAQVPIGQTFFGKTGHFLSDLPGLGQLVSLLVENAIAIAAVILLILFVIAGLNIVTGAGDVQKVQRGQDIITAGIIGFIVVLAAYLIVKLIQSSLGVPILGE